MSLGTAEGWKNMGTGLMDFADRLNPNSPTGMMKNVQTVENVTSYVSNIPNMSAEALGHDIGFGLEKIGEAALLSKGASAVSNVLKGGEVVEAANAAKGEVTVYRVFGGDARAQGFSWTTVNPTSVKDFRNFAGLPSGEQVGR